MIGPDRGGAAVRAALRWLRARPALAASAGAGGGCPPRGSDTAAGSRHRAAICRQEGEAGRPSPGCWCGDGWAGALGRVRGSRRRAQQGDRGAAGRLAWNFQGALGKFRGGAGSAPPPAPPPARAGPSPCLLPPSRLPLPSFTLFFFHILFSLFLSFTCSLLAAFPQFANMLPCCFHLARSHSR